MRFSFTLFTLTACLLLSGCSDTERLDRLDADIRAIKADTTDEVEKMRKIVSSTGGSSAGSAPSSVSARLDRLESRFTELLTKYDDRGDMAYLRANAQGSAIMQTDHGPMMVRLEGIDLNVGGQGFTLQLDIGNPSGVAISQFLLKGDYGAGTPVLPEGQSYSIFNPQIDEWLRTLKPFEVRVNKRLAPMSWTPVDIVLNASSRDDFELIRFTMLPEVTEIEGIEAMGGGSSNSFTHISADSRSAAVLKTDYGAFLIAVNKAETKGIGTRLEIQIGNPYGFEINQCRLVGDFGTSIPRRKVGEQSAKFQARLREWTESVKPFNAQITSKIAALQWSQATIIIPGSVDEVKTLRAQLRIENVTLPQPK